MLLSPDIDCAFKRWSMMYIISPPILITRMGTGSNRPVYNRCRSCGS